MTDVEVYSVLVTRIKYRDKTDKTLKKRRKACRNS